MAKKASVKKGARPAKRRAPARAKTVSLKQPITDVTKGLAAVKSGLKKAAGALKKSKLHDKEGESAAAYRALDELSQLADTLHQHLHAKMLGEFCESKSMRSGFLFDAASGKSIKKTSGK